MALGWTYAKQAVGLSHLSPPVRILVLSVLLLPVTAYVVGPRRLLDARLALLAYLLGQMTKHVVQ